MKQPIEVVMLQTEDKTNIFRTDNESLHYTTNTITGGLRCRYLYITVSQDVEPIKEGDWVIYKNNVGSESILCQAYKHKDDDRMLFDTNDGSYDRSTGEGITPLKDDVRKIITTTDPNLLFEKSIYDPRSKTGGMGISTGISQVQQSFLKEFVKNPNGEWEVEYVEIFEAPDPYPSMQRSSIKLKLNQDSTVNITSVEPIIPIHIHEGIYNTHVEIVDGIVHVKPNYVGEKRYSKEEVVSLLNDYGNHVANCFFDCEEVEDIDEENWIKENL